MFLFDKIVPCPYINSSFTSKRRHTRFDCDWSSDVCSSDLYPRLALAFQDRIFPGFAYQIYQGFEGQKNQQGKEISSVPQLINFRGPARSYPIVPYYRILRDEIDPAVFRDKIVIVGSFSPSLHDIFPTPFSASAPTAGD